MSTVTCLTYPHPPLPQNILTTFQHCDNFVTFFLLLGACFEPLKDWTSYQVPSHGDMFLRTMMPPTSPWPRMTDTHTQTYSLNPQKYPNWLKMTPNLLNEKAYLFAPFPKEVSSGHFCGCWILQSRKMHLLGAESDQTFRSTRSVQSTEITAAAVVFQRWAELWNGAHFNIGSWWSL